MLILGISAYYHDSAAALIRDGDIVAAAQEERFTRKKHDSAFPHYAVKYCLAEAGIPLSNQSVLLKGVNDSYEAMRSLLWGLQRIGVRPYYLFQGDDVAGTGHLRAELKGGREIMARLRSNISGLCLPRYILDTPGEEGKILLD